MVASTINTREFTDAVLAKLQANTEGIVVTDGEGPNPVTAYPYAVLYPLISTELSDEGGPLSDPDAHRIMEWQITSVATSRVQAQWCADLMRTQLQASPLAVTGRSIWRIIVSALGEIERDDDVDIGGITGSLFYANETIEIPSAPG